LSRHDTINIQINTADVYRQIKPEPETVSEPARSPVQTDRAGPKSEEKLERSLVIAQVHVLHIPLPQFYVFLCVGL